MLKKFLAVIALSLLGVSTSLSTAQAGTPQEQHCVVAATGEMSCYASQAAALRAASGGRINLPDNASLVQVEDAIDQSNTAAAMSESPDVATPKATVVQAIMWTDKFFHGSSLTFVATATCPNGGAGVWNNFQDPWDNELESAKLYAGCYGRGYDFGDVGWPYGASYGFYYEAHYVSFGSFRNEMSAFKTCVTSC